MQFVRCRVSLPDGVAIKPEAHAPAAITSRVWRRALAEVRGAMDDISYDHIAAIAALLPGDETHLPGVRVLFESGNLVFLPYIAEDACSNVIVERSLPLAGCLHLPEAHCRLLMMECPGPFTFSGGDHAVLDADSVRGGLTVRAWEPGDRFRPLGAPGRRKLQDIFVDAGVPRRWRKRIPVITDADGIIWVAGFRLADRVKITATTTRCVQLTIEWEFNPWI